MSELALIAGASAGTSILGTLSSSYSESMAIKSQSAYQAQQLELNSRIANIQAKSAERRGKQEALEYKKGVKQLIGKQRASMAAQGIDISSGTALDIQVETAELGELDALTIRNNAFREAAGYRVESVGYSGQAGMTRVAGKYSARNTLLTGGLSAISQGMQAYYKYKNV